MADNPNNPMWNNREWVLSPVTGRYGLKIITNGEVAQSRIDLYDSYIYNLLKKTGWEDEAITPELIELKRNILKLKRSSKPNKNVTARG